MGEHQVSKQPFQALEQSLSFRDNAFIRRSRKQSYYKQSLQSSVRAHCMSANFVYDTPPFFKVDINFSYVNVASFTMHRILPNADFQFTFFNC